MFQEKIEKALAKLTGQPVRIETFKLSPFSGSIEITGLHVGELLQIRHAEGQLSMAKALAKEIAIKSMTIDGVLLRLSDADLKKIKLPQPPTKETWKVSAESLVLRDLSVNLPQRELSLEKIAGELRQSGTNVRFEFNIATVKRKLQKVNATPLHGTGSFSDITDLSQLLSAKMQLGLQLEFDLRQLFGL